MRTAIVVLFLAVIMARRWREERRKPGACDCRTHHSCGRWGCWPE